MATLDPVLEALDRAPLGEEDLASEDLAELDRRADEMMSGRVGVAPADVRRTIDGMRKLAG